MVCDRLRSVWCVWCGVSSSSLLRALLLFSSFFRHQAAKYTTNCSLSEFSCFLDMVDSRSGWNPQPAQAVTAGLWLCTCCLAFCLFHFTTSTISPAPPLPASTQRESMHEWKQWIKGARCRESFCLCFCSKQEQQAVASLCSF